jgi:hypothetical protein
MRERTGKSPDEFDWLACLVEMARRRGFNIARLGAGNDIKSPQDKWLEDENAEQDKIMREHMLVHS